MSIEKINIPIFVGNDKYEPTTVSPRLLFYNGTKKTIGWWLDYNNTMSNLSIYPRFDVYSGNTPNSSSKSLLFYNEETSVGMKPTDSVYTLFWEKYISTLYNPKTRLLEAKGIIPLDLYFDLVLNDIVEFKGNYYHLITINNYNVNTGECDIELLGPIIYDSLAIDIPINIELPTVSLISWYSDNYTIYINGNIINEGSSALTGCGVCYSITNPEPTILDAKLVSTTQLGIFNKSLTLQPNTDYWFRIYGTNQYGSSYSTTIQVNISPEDLLPVIQTLEPNTITSNSVNLRMNISSEGDSAITEAGWVWSTSANPTIANNKLTISDFSYSIKEKTLTGLTNLTEYYIKAYAINGSGVVYGQQFSFYTTQKSYNIAIRLYNDSDYVPYNGVKIDMSKLIYDFPTADKEVTLYPAANTMIEYPLSSKVNFLEEFSFNATLLGMSGSNIIFSQQYNANSYASLTTISGGSEVAVDYMLYNYDGYVNNDFNPGPGIYPYCGVSMNIQDDKSGSVMYLNIYLRNRDFV